MNIARQHDNLSDSRPNLRWTARGACLDSDPDLFFPLTWDEQPAQHSALARRICLACPVRLPCLAWAVETGEPDGMWGGTTPTERRRIRSTRERKTAARAPVRVCEDGD
ncbi:WhiB family transcriptional regulator [Streptosporangium lutulentum]|uniref:Transcriptional regulator WhiB n=1 Tax=Streptosporangium lutulentum TaxID=1461250 RepID=A0ABT9QK19_9ACTN|nr:WhiB family transcriptional regulator [Streptosporangium lutulentum]MDP9846279.1 WhiB family redox-sensing transcriptional regulator [Streptosporangium lutulentum]